MANSRAALYLTIPLAGRPDTGYRVEFLNPTPAVIVAWRLTKKDGTTYDVALTEHGFTCTCADWQYRRSNAQDGCKHVEACRAKGLFGRRNLPRSEA